MHRYRNNREGTRFEALLSLLSEVDLKQAEVLGKAMRLGAMLWANSDDDTAKIVWAPKRMKLSLTLTAEAYPLFGEVAEARFEALASALNATTQVDMKLT